MIDEPTLTARTRELRARAQTLHDAAEQRYHTALIAEFHPRTEEQRKVLFEHGRAEVLHRNGTLCWQYLKDAVRDTFGWNRAGQLAGDTHVDEVAIEFERIGYGVATFASGECRSSGCAENGWNTKLPDGAALEIRCHSGGCLKDGWEAKLPGGATIETRCRAVETSSVGAGAPAA